MTTNIRRRLLTDLVISTLGMLSPVPPVGDLIIPVGGGWNGEPNLPANSFTAYLVVTPITASRSSGPLGDSQSEWQMPFVVQSFGADRSQCELMADDARDALVALRGQLIDLGNSGDPRKYKVQQVRDDIIGGVTRVAVASYPPFFGEQDQLTFWLSKSTAP